MCTSTNTFISVLTRPTRMSFPTIYIFLLTILLVKSVCTDVETFKQYCFKQPDRPAQVPPSLLNGLLAVFFTFLSHLLYKNNIHCLKMVIAWRGNCSVSVSFAFIAKACISSIQNALPVEVSFVFTMSGNSIQRNFF